MMRKEYFYCPERDSYAVHYINERGEWGVCTLVLSRLFQGGSITAVQYNAVFPFVMSAGLPVYNYHSNKVQYTGRQLRPLSSVLYRIISKRRYILAAQLLLREKSGT
jgi:hypothetical protein